MPSRKLALLPTVLLLVTQAHAVTNAVDYNVTGYDVAPDLSKYKFDPYPPLKDDKGSQFDAANVRGTRLFGYIRWLLQAVSSGRLVRQLRLERSSSEGVLGL